MDNEVNATLFKKVFWNQHLQRLNAGIFFLHLMLTSTFFAIPFLLQHQIKQGHLTVQWHFYLPLMVCAFLGMLPFIVLAERKQAIKPVLLSAVAIIGISQCLLACIENNWFLICGVMFTYFVAFNILEASLPSLVSKQADSSSKGTAMGIYSSSQFLGIFVGGALSGVIYQYLGGQGIFIMNSLVALIWFMIATQMKPNLYQLTLIIPYHTPSQDEPALIQSLLALPGVYDAVISNAEGVIYLRVNKMTYPQGLADQLVNKTITEGT